jgi:hypothetical protein
LERRAENLHHISPPGGDIALFVANAQHPLEAAICLRKYYNHMNSLGIDLL